MGIDESKILNVWNCMFIYILSLEYKARSFDFENGSQQGFKIKKSEGHCMVEEGTLILRMGKQTY